MKKTNLSDEELESINQRLGKLDQYLSDYEEDLKVATIHIESHSRWGYKVKFDMQLPGRHIYAEDHDRNLMLVVGKVADAVRRQLKKHLHKLRSH